MKINAWTIGIVLVILYLFTGADGIKERSDNAAYRRERREKVSDRVRESELQKSDAIKLSSIALERYRQGCVMVIDSNTQLDAMHEQGLPVEDTKTGLYLPPDTLVCNRRNWTARLDSEGLISDVAKVSRYDGDQNGVPDTQDVRRLLNDQTR